MSRPKKIVLDVDVGTDDAVALLVLLHAEKEGLVKIEAICCSNGNTTLENVCTNVIRLLEILERTDIPVYKGAVNSLIQLETGPSHFHGSDGFGDLQCSTKPDETIIKSEPSSVGMYNIAAKYPGEITLICLGPLTNVALALRIYPTFANLIKEIHLMGGSYKAIGNVTRTAEFNFYIDPEAAHVVFSCTKSPVTILPWEACLKSTFPFDWRYNVYGKSDNPVVQLLNVAEKNIYKYRSNEDWIPCDAFVAAAFVYPYCVEKKSKHHVTVELHGRETRGQMVLDHRKQQQPNAHIIERINTESFKNILLLSVGCKADDE